MKVLYRFFGLLLTIFLPFLLILTSARILFTPSFLDYEYRTPNFPPDPYGFNLADRLKYSKLSMDYLFNDQGIEYLSQITMPDGKPLYNERELSHMLDVKNLIQKALIVYYGIILYFAIMIFWSWKGNWQPIFWRAISQGGWLTIGVILAILLGVVLNFDVLFADFHHLFFTGDTWLFYESDSLIRLFPLKLWSDAFTFMGVISLAGGVILGLMGLRLYKRTSK